VTPAELDRLRAAMARPMFFPEARALALLMLAIHERRKEPNR
jgi:hypothetical protein